MLAQDGHMHRLCKPPVLSVNTVLVVSRRSLRGAYVPSNLCSCAIALIAQVTPRTANACWCIWYDMQYDLQYPMQYHL